MYYGIKFLILYCYAIDNVKQLYVTNKTTVKDGNNLV